MPEMLPGSATEAKLLTDDRFLRKLAYLYYEDGYSQEAIAGMEFCSRQTVSKALQKARDRGIVRISIVPGLRTGYIRNLSREVRLELFEQRFGEHALGGPERGDVPFGPFHVVDRHERGLATLRQAHVVRGEVEIDAFAQRIDRRPLRIAVGPSDPRILVHAR